MPSAAARMAGGGPVLVTPFTSWKNPLSAPETSAGQDGGLGGCRRSLLIGHRRGNPTGRGWRNSTRQQANSANRPVTSFARAFALSLLRAKMRQGRDRHDSGRGRCVSDLRSSADHCRRCTDRLDAWLRNPDGNLRPRRTHGRARSW